MNRSDKFVEVRHRNSKKLGKVRERHPDSFGARFGLLVLRYRQKHEMSQEELAEELFNDRGRKSDISALENGFVRKPQAKTIGNYAVVLGVPQEEIDGCREAGPDTAQIQGQPRNARQSDASAPWGEAARLALIESMEQQLAKQLGIHENKGDLSLRSVIATQLSVELIRSDIQSGVFRVLDFPESLSRKLMDLRLVENALSGIGNFMYFKDWIDTPIMRSLPRGQFNMGAPETDLDAYDNERPTRLVSIQKPFSISVVATTFAEYDKFCASTNRTLPPDEGWGRGARPAIHVSWEDALGYASWLTELTGQSYRLPSEAEWEYAARAGTSGPYLDLDVEDPRSIGNCCEVHAMTKEAASYDPNKFGIFDMLGNVWEWVGDSWFPSYGGAPVNAQARVSSSHTLKCLRGGSWDCIARHMRVTDRCRQGMANHINNVGFRLVRESSP